MAATAEILSRRSRPNFQASIETRLLYDRLRKLAVGEIVSYRELTEIISQDVQGDGRGALQTARRLALRDDAIVCDVVKNIGVKRLSDREVVQSGSHTFVRVRRLAQRGAERLAAADPSALSSDENARRFASMAALAVVKLMGKPKSVDKIAAANNVSGELPVARTLELFRGLKPV